MDNYNEEDVQWLYGRMIDDGVDAGTIDDFKESLKNDADRDWYHKRAKKMGLDVGDADEFRSWTVPEEEQAEGLQYQDTGGTEVDQAVDDAARQYGRMPQDVQDASWNYPAYGQKYNGPGGQAMFTDEELAEQAELTRNANQPSINATDTSGMQWTNAEVANMQNKRKRENPNKGVAYQQKESWTGSYARTPDEYGEMHYGWQRGERVKRLNKQGVEFAGYGGHKGTKDYNDALDWAEMSSDDEIVAMYDRISKTIGPDTDLQWFANTEDGYRAASQLKALQHELHARDLGFAHDRDVENAGMEDYAGVRTDKVVADVIDSMEGMSPQERDAMAQAAYDRGLDSTMSVDDENTILAVAALRSKDNGRRVEDNYRELQQQMENHSLYATLERDMDSIFNEEKAAMEQREKDAVGGLVYAGGEGAEVAYNDTRTVEAIKAGNLPETFNVMTNRLLQESEAARRFYNRRVGELSKREGIIQARAIARDELRQMFRTKYIEGNPLTPKSDAQYIVQSVLFDNMWSKMNQASMGLAAGASYHEMKATLDEGMQMYAETQASTAARIIAPCAVLVFDAATGSFFPASYASKGATMLFGKGVNKAVSWLGNRLFGIGSEMAIRRAGENTALRILSSAIGGAANFATYEFESELFGGTASGTLSAESLGRAAVGGAGKGFVFGFVGGAVGKITEGATGMRAIIGEIGTIAAEGTTFTAMDYLSNGHQLTPEIVGTSFGMAIAGRMAHPVEYAGDLLSRVAGRKQRNAPNKPPRISKEMAARLQGNYPALTALLSGDGLAKDIVKSFKGSAIDKQDANSRLDAIEEEYRRLKFDKNVPWSVVRIAEYVVQGRVIPQPWMMNSDIRTDENGNEYGVTLDGEGRVIEEYKFKNDKEREKWRAATSRQSDINRISVAAENLRRSEFTDILEATINEVAEAQGMDAAVLRDVIMNGKDGNKQYKTRDKVYQQAAKDVEKAVDAKLKSTESPVDIAIRAVENKYGISIDQALEYPVYQRTEREAKAVEELQQRLSGEYSPERDMTDAEIIEAEKAEAHDEGMQAEGERRAELKERLEDAANTLGEMGIDPAEIDRMDDATLASWMQERDMDAETAAAVMDYQNAKAAFEGIRDRVQEEAQKRIEESNRQTDERTNPDTNAIHPVKMKEGGEQGRDAFVIGGKIVINQDGTVDTARSDESIIVLYPDTGEKMVKTIADVKSGEPTIDPERVKQDAAQQITEEVAGQVADDMNRTLPFNVGDTYDVMKGGTIPEKVTVIGLDAEGRPILKDSKGELVNKEVDEQGNPVGVDREWVQQMADQYREAMRNGKEQGPRQSRATEDRPAEQQGEPAPVEGRPAERTERPAAPAVGGDPMERVVYYRTTGKSEERIEKEIANGLAAAKERLERAQRAWDESKETDEAKLDAMEQELNDARREVEYWQEVDRYRKASREPENARPEPRTSLGGQETERPAAQPIVQPAQERRPVQQQPAEQWRPSGVDEREVRKERPAGFSEEDKRFWSREGDDIVEVMDQAAKDMGLAVATYDDPNGENGYIQGGVIYLNSAKGRAAVGFVMGHEMTHEMQRRDQKDGEDGKKEDGDRYKRFRELALQYAKDMYTPTRVNGVRCNTYEDYLKARLDVYQNHIRNTTRNRVFKEYWDQGMDNDSAMAIADREADAAANAFTLDDLKNEVTADTAGMFLDDADMARKILGQEQDLSWLQRQKEALMEWLEKKLAQLTGHGEEYKKMKALQQSLQDVYQEAVRKGRGDQTQDQAIRYSLDTMANQFGLRYEKGADGKTHFYEDHGRDKDGNPIRGREITKFMPIHIERSPVGAVLRQGFKDGIIDEAQYNRTIANQCAIMQHMKDADNLDQFFAVSGAIGFAQLPADAKEIQRDYYKIDMQGRVAFTPYVSNSETQYATSFDVTTICRKTQTMIDVMCETMKRQHHGLTADEVVKIVYDNVYKLGKGRNDGGDVLVPCDVCYVFNRWVNLGKVFDTMRRMRDTYSDMPVEKIQKEREKNVVDLCDYYRVTGNKEEYRAYKDYLDARARYDAMRPKDRQSQEGKELAKSLKAFDAAMKDAMAKRQQAVAEEIDKINWKIFNYEHLLKKDPAYKPTAKELKRLEELQRELDYLDKGTWFDYVRLQEDYTPIPDEVLFDMNKSYEFKENYPGAWKYRTTRGPNAGKAAAAYSPQYFGNGIVGASKSATSGPEAIQDLSNNVFLAREEGADGRWHYKYIDEETWTLKPEAVVVLRKAQDNAAAQNYLGGQRFQSTSDTRTEYLTDYNTFMLEQMVIGSKGQGFTKVPECAKLFGDTGTMFNLSLIAKGKGYEELTPAQYKALSDEDKRDCAVIDGKILHALYSDVSGINHRDAFKLNDYYPNLQPIMVCINRTHTRLMMALAKQGRVPFNIPYHASGDSTDRFLSKAATVGDDVDMESRDDYEPYQNDLVIDPKDKQAAMVRDVFVKIKTGAKFTDEEMSYLRGLDHDNVMRQLYMRFRGEDVDGRPARILNKYLLEKDRNTAGEGYGSFDSQCRVKEYDSKTGEYLKDENDNFVYKQVKLNSRQAALLMPNDYWDKTIDRDRADENGQAFLDLCVQQGLYPRFGGWKNVQGKRVYSPDHDFTKEPGYYSTLIDISMYNNDGSPVEHKPIDASAIGDGHFIKDKMTQLGDYRLSELGGNPKLSHPALQDAIYKSVMDVAANRAKETIEFAKQVRAMRESGAEGKSVITDETPSWIEGEWRNNPAFVREVARLSTMSDKQLSNWERRRMQEAENNATAAPGDGEVHYSLREEEPPKKTIKVYKLFNVFPKGHPHAGEPMTLFIDSNQPLQRGVWLNADAPSIENLENLEPGYAYLVDADGNVVGTKAVRRNNKNKIVGLPGVTQIRQASQDGNRWMTVMLDADGEKVYHNVGINGSGSPSTYAMRPGWHATDAPSARHIGEGKDGGNAVYRRPNQRWFEVEIAADNDYNEEARSRFAQMHPKMKREDIDANLKGDIPERIPKDGYYNFKTNSNANPNQSWYIAGAMKIGRPLSEAEARYLAEKKGVEPDLPYKDGVKDFDEEDFNPDGPDGGVRVDNAQYGDNTHDGDDIQFSLADGEKASGVTLFSGGGLIEAGLRGVVDPRAAVEYDKKIAGVYRDNHGNHIVTADVRDVDPMELAKQVNGPVEYFHASPVCKNFSVLKNGGEKPLDIETAQSTANAIEKMRPRIVTIENVANYQRSDALKVIADKLDELGYTHDIHVVDAADYGAATHRRRLILRAVAPGNELPSFPEGDKSAFTPWYDRVEDLVEGLPESTMPDWMAKRLEADGIEWRSIDKPMLVMSSGAAYGGIGHAYADEAAPTIAAGRTGDRIVLPGGEVKKVTSRVLARLMGLDDNYSLPKSESLAHTILGNGVPIELTKNVIGPLVKEVAEPSERRYSLSNFERPQASDLLKEYEDFSGSDNFALGMSIIENDYKKGDAKSLHGRVDSYTLNARYWEKELKKDLKTGFHETSATIKHSRAIIERESKLAEYAKTLLNDLVKDRKDYSSWSVKKGKDITIDDMDGLFKGHNADDYNAELWDRVLSVSRQLGVDNIRFNKTPDNVMGRVLGGRVRFDDAWFNDKTVSDAEKCETMLHEMIHHATVYAMHYPERLTENQRAAVRELESVYEQIKNDYSFRGEYGIKNAREMVAELSNPEFREKLKKKNLWQRIVDGIARLFWHGSDGAEQTNAHDFVRSNLERLLDDFNKGAYDKFAEETRSYRPRFSLSNEEREAQTHSENFKRWFGDWERDPENASKVVDKDGRPLVVTHWTDREFYEFDRDRLGENTDLNATDENFAKTAHIGFWFNDDGNSETFRNAYGEDARQMQSYLDIKNPKEYESMADLVAELGNYETAEDFVADSREKGFDGIVVNDEEFGGKSYAAFQPTQIKSATENNGEFSRENPDIRYSLWNTFYSNAARAVEGVRQEKAKAEQWKAMLTKAGGIKAGEDKWMGLSEWLDEHKGETLTKDEVRQFVAENGIRMEETHYGEGMTPEGLFKRYVEGSGANNSDLHWTEWFDNRADGSIEFLGNQEERVETADLVNKKDGLVDPQNYDLTTSEGREEYISATEEELSALAESQTYDDRKIINFTRLNYTTLGLENKREIAFVVPGVEPYQEHDEIHFGPENQGRAVMWVRFGETTDTEGNRVLVIDEVQSNRHQDAREKGYADKDAIKTRQKIDELRAERSRLAIEQLHKLGYAVDADEDGIYDADAVDAAWEGELGGADAGVMKRIKDITQEARELLDKMTGEIPAAPFEKNWHEVAMKRMLRLAAEEGFDKVAWTTGEQQADRYDLSKGVDWIQRGNDYGEDPERIFIKLDEKVEDVELDGNGIIVDASRKLEEAVGKPLSDVIGRELAEKAMAAEPGAKGRISGDGLKVGGKGMKSFYDGILPQFMDKYGKRWGVKTGEVTLDTPGGETMHSVDVNEDMKRSVMQGQPLFSLGAPYQGSKNKIAKDIVDILPRGRRFVDLFSGGGAVTHAAMLSDKHGTFHMNDINPVGQRGFVSGMNGEWEDYDREINTPEEFDQVRGTMEGIIHSHNYFGRNVAKDGGSTARAGINRMKSLGALKPYADRVSTTETDYRDVQLQPGDVVYADIPYEKTDRRGYGEPRFDKGEFVEWAQAQDVPVFVSEYTMPDGWTEIGSFTVRGARGGHREEKLWVQDKFADQVRDETAQYPNSDGPRYQLSEDIENYQPRDVSWERSMLDHLLETAGRNREAVDKRRDALRTLNNQAGALRRAMGKQREYDRWTVDDLVSMAKAMLKSGLYKDMSPYEVSRLVGMINQGAGREDITRQANSVFDLMMKHHVKEWKNQFNKLLMVRENRIDKNGVRVQGALDPKGQRMVKALRNALGFDEDTLSERIWDCRERMGSDDPVVAGNAVDEYEGLMLAQQHYDTVGRLTKALEELQHERRTQLERVYEYWREGRLDDYGNVIYRQDGMPSTVEKHRLRPEFGGLDEEGNHQPVSEENKAIRRQVDATVVRIEQAMRETEVELAEGYRSLCDNVGGSVASSITRAKEWVESEKERVGEIQHAANSDLLNVEEKLSGMDRSKESGVANNAVVRFLNSPLGSFEKFMRYFGQRSAYGEGRLFNRFMRGHSDCTDAEWRAYKEGLDAMNRKSEELFGCSWEKLMVKMRGGAFANTKRRLGIEREFPPVEVSYWVDGKRVDDTLNQDEVAYLIACSKMTDGMMKLENMGIDENMIEQLRQQVDPRVLELADWYQGEFLPKQRARINEVYKRMFGADMAHIENYIHLNINQRGLTENKDINQRMAVSETPSTITGSLKERRRNVKPIDLHTSLLDLALGEHQKMENWIAWAEYNRDLKDLLNYKKFKNKVLNMKSVELGSGEQLWDKFTKAVAVVTGDFQGGGKHSEMDRFATNAAKFVSSGCINFRVHTALKQVLSFPAFMSDARPGDILHAAGNAMGSVKWAMENLPGFSKRWESRRVGDTRLMDTDSDYSFWRNRWVQKVNKAGMTANASVDCLTVAIGARAVYETAKRRYLSYGYTEEQAERKALQDAYTSYNSSQQSSEGAFVSPMQVERTFFSAIGTTFRNASMGYERRVTTGARNIARMLKSGYKEDMVENTKKQMMEEGLTEEQAQRAAERVYNRQLWHSIMDVANFGYALPFLWILGPTLSYLIAGDDNDIKKDTLADLGRHAMFGPIEGLTFGGVMSEVGNMVLNNRIQGNEWKDLWKELEYKDLTPLPLVSRMQGLVKSYKKDAWTGFNDLAGLIIQSNIGVDPNTITDAAVAVLDACNGDLDLSKEVAFGLMRILQFPQSQIDNLYIDELGLKGEDLGKYSYEELARRYAHYKTSRSVLPSLMRDDAANQEAEDKMVERFEEKVQERIAKMDEGQLKRAFDSNDPDLKKMVGKQMAKDAGLDNEKYSKSPASNASERTARAHTTYQRIRSYADMAEDLLLESEQNKAKENGDEERKEAISKAREKLNGIINGKDATKTKSEVKGLGQGDDKKVMERLREERKKVLKELKITR